MEVALENTEAAIETRADSARVETGFENLDTEQTMVAFKELDKVLHGLAEQVVHSLKQMTPHLAEMQSLLSQRGKARKEVLKLAGLPKWSEYAKEYAQKLDCSMRTIQDHITGLRRNGKSGPSQSTKTRHQPNPDDGRKRSKPWHADAKDSRPMAEAQIAVNGLIATYEAGADLELAYQRYKKVAVSPAKLNAIFEATTLDATKVDLQAEIKRKLVRVVETAECYIRALEVLVHSPSVSLTETQRQTLQKPMGEWRSILRYARGVQAEKTGEGVSTESAPIFLAEVA